jgi:hypothetical protein
VTLYRNKLSGKPLLKRLYFMEWGERRGDGMTAIKRPRIFIRIFYKLHVTQKPVNFLRKGIQPFQQFFT